MSGLNHPSVPDDTPRYALWLIRNGQTRRLGHHLGRAVEGMAVCRHCGAAMVDTDAYAYFTEKDHARADSWLGSFAYACPGRNPS